MQSKFEDVKKNQYKFANISLNTKINNKVLNSNNIIIRDFIESLNAFYNEIKKYNTNDINIFIKNNIKNLENLKDTLVSKNRIIYNNIYDNTVKNNLTNMFRKIYIKLDYNKYLENRQKFVTTIFTEFAKGITYFKTELQESRFPVYHRNASCGTKNVTTQTKFAKTLFGPDKSKYVQRCYIERMLYDNIYNHIIGLQDIGHMVELRIITQIYEKYFPEKTSKLNIIYNNDFPISLTIDFYNKKNTITNIMDKKIEFYKKLKLNNSYEDNVICINKDIINKINITNQQNFDSTTNALS